MTHFDKSYSWRVEFTVPGKDYATNKSVTVICEKVETAVHEVYNKWPEATIVKVFRGQDWGNAGVIVVEDVEEQPPAWDWQQAYEPIPITNAAGGTSALSTGFVPYDSFIPTPAHTYEPVPDWLNTNIPCRHCGVSRQNGAHFMVPIPNATKEPGNVKHNYEPTGGDVIPPGWESKDRPCRHCGKYKLHGSHLLVSNPTREPGNVAMDADDPRWNAMENDEDDQ